MLILVVRLVQFNDYNLTFVYMNIITARAPLEDCVKCGGCHQRECFVFIIICLHLTMNCANCTLRRWHQIINFILLPNRG